jgi:hypothetical protein
VAPSIVSDVGPSSLKGYWRARTRSDVEESIASLRANLSIAPGRSRGKKWKVICTTPDMPEDLVREMRIATAADIGAEMIRRVEEIIRMVITSTNLKGTYIKIQQPLLLPGRCSCSGGLDPLALPRPQDSRMRSRRCSRRKTRSCGKSLREWR